MKNLLGKHIPKVIGNWFWATANGFLIILGVCSICCILSFFPSMFMYRNLISFFGMGLFATYFIISLAVADRERRYCFLLCVKEARKRKLPIPSYNRTKVGKRTPFTRITDIFKNNRSAVRDFFPALQASCFIDILKEEDLLLTVKQIEVYSEEEYRKMSLFSSKLSKSTVNWALLLATISILERFIRHDITWLSILGIVFMILYACIEWMRLKMKIEAKWEREKERYLQLSNFLTHYREIVQEK